MYKKPGSGSTLERMMINWPPLSVAVPGTMAAFGNFCPKIFEKNLNFSYQ